MRWVGSQNMLIFAHIQGKKCPLQEWYGTIPRSSRIAKGVVSVLLAFIGRGRTKDSLSEVDLGSIWNIWQNAAKYEKFVNLVEPRKPILRTAALRILRSKMRLYFQSLHKMGISLNQ
jgi:hypothetical protein